jgi:hypothetical protein
MGAASQRRQCPCLLLADFVAKVRCNGLGWRALVKTHDFDALALTLFTNSEATQCTEPQLVAVVPPVLRAAGGSERWLQEQTRPERRVGRAIAVARV